MLWLVLLKMRLARIAFANRRAWRYQIKREVYEWLTDLIRYLLLIFPWEIDKVVVFCPNEERYGCLVESATLPVPFLD